MDAIDLNSQRDDDEDDDDWDNNVNIVNNINGWGSSKDDRDCDVQGDSSLTKNVRVGVLTMLPLS